MTAEQKDRALPSDAIIEAFKRGMKRYPWSQNRRVRMATVARRLRISARKVRIVSAHVRLQGYPLGSDTNGYFYADTPEAVNVTVRRMEAKARGLIEIARAMRGAHRPSDSGESQRSSQKKGSDFTTNF